MCVILAEAGMTPMEGSSAIPPGEQTQPQGIQFDETFRIALIISACIILERHHLLAIERIRQLPTDYMHAALVTIQTYVAGNLSLAIRSEWRRGGQECVS